MKWFHGNLAWNGQENGNGIREQWQWQWQWILSFLSDD
jgi:hypothetical protein